MDDAYAMNCCMDHRGGVGFEKNTGDGAGIMTGLPDKLLRKECRNLMGFELPDAGQYGVGNVFLPNDEAERALCKRLIESELEPCNLELIGWRELPVSVHKADVGETALSAMPKIEQLFIKAAEAMDSQSLDRQLYLVRKSATHKIRAEKGLLEGALFYVCSLSSQLLVYKGMLTPEQVFQFFDDLNDPDYETHLAMVHSRFSTNTFPSWDRAQPSRFMSHNGEINTLLGNVNAMNAREGNTKSNIFGDNLKKLFPIIEPNCSDSGNFDNVLEFLIMNGRSIPEALMMMVPEAWQQHQNMSEQKRAFYEYHSCLIEPWDGPASMAFSDGRCIGAILDRNGLRPSRFYITKDDRCIMASEVGVVREPAENILRKGRLQPGRIFLIDFDQGRMISDHELKERIVSKEPYETWLAKNRLELSEIPSTSTSTLEHDLTALQQSFGYTQETMEFMLNPMVKELRDPLGSMGNDAALAIMSDKPRMLYDYFKQRFAQVTNPPIDSIREEVIMSLECYIGPEGNFLEPKPEHSNRLKIMHPLLDNEETAGLISLDFRGWKSKVIDITFDVDEKSNASNNLISALDRINQQVESAIEEGYSLAVLSDRNVGANSAAISSLFAIGSVHHHLVSKHLRNQIGLVLETGEAREVHHFCLLVGFGADAINPYLALETLEQSRIAGEFGSIPEITSREDVVTRYKKAVGKGMLKVMAKMGISTLHSYKGAQIFEAVGLSSEVIELAFKGTASRVEGLTLHALAEEMTRRHLQGFPQRGNEMIGVLPNHGDFHWRRNGDTHMWEPKSVASLQVAARTNSQESYETFAKQINEENTKRSTLRGLLDFSFSENPVPLEEVEAEKDIVKRFATGAMSFGSISAEAHESLAIAMNRLGGKSNTGEGGEDAKRFIPLSNGDSKRSAIKQVASGRFGVTINYLTNADELQIKIIQGAKPGEGGELPGGKVDDYIASLRHSTPGVGLISPPPHHDIYSIEDMAQLIHDLKNANRSARISVKLGAEVGVGTVAAGVTKARADHIVIAGDSGGTGASPLTSIKHAGLPWELGIAETHQTLVMNNLRSRVVLQTDGQIKTGRDVAIAAILGAEEFGFATAPLIAMGCIMMRKCHLNTCPVGIATQDPELRKKFTGSPEHVVNYLFMVASELREIMSKLGIRTINEMIGAVELLNVKPAVNHWKAKGLDLSPLLTKAKEPRKFLGSYQIHEQDHELEKALDNELIKLALPALKKGEKVRAELPIINTNRVVGAMLSNEIIKQVGPEMLPDETIQFKFSGSAGQSFGCWLAKGIELTVEGDANDYTGKGLSGGRVIVFPPAESTFLAEENIVVGNVALYGATSGQAFFRGIAAERFCVRNSGASAVVEGVGDHGCEYMTGGRVVVLGETGRNFAAGMSGGIAYIWDQKNNFEMNCNLEMVDLEKVDSEESEMELKDLIQMHASKTGSTRATEILENWDEEKESFIKVMPRDYKRALQAKAAHRKSAA